MRLGGGRQARVPGRRRRRPPRVHPQRAAGVRRAWVDRVRHVGDEDDQRIAVGEIVEIASFAEDLGLSALTPLQAIRAYRNCPFLLNYSPTLLPRPRDWPRHAYVTGFWSVREVMYWNPPPNILVRPLTDD